ncbi:MAG: MBL fold metallo-hydrolase [Actinomycetota bacterium]|nr:MBL fold metallo-hydrolase [Actinomycetota bacterium]
MILTVLGCDGSYPGPGGAGSGYLVECGPDVLWVDTGPGTLGALQTHRSLSDLTAVVITHEHPDHRSDIDGLAVAIRFGPFADHERIPVFAPAGVRESCYFAEWDVFDWRTVAGGDSRGLGQVRLSFSRTDHGPETLAVRLDGDGACIGYSADSGPGWSLAALGPDIDLAVCEATWPAEHEGNGGHMSGRQAGASAREAEVGELLLTHRAPWAPPDVVAAEAAAAFGRQVHQAMPGARYRVAERRAVPLTSPFESPAGRR